MIRPDFRQIKHYGVSATDDPPGRGSGRYPLGSGDRPYQNGVIKKGATVSRLSLVKNENEKDYRKYVSIQDAPEKVWVDMFSRAYSRMGYRKLYSNKYETVRDLKVSNVEQNKKYFDEWFDKNSDTLFWAIPIAIDQWERSTGAQRSHSTKEDFFKQLAMNNDINEMYFEYMKKKGFDAIEDVYGKSSGGENSVIVLDPDKTLKLTDQEKIKIRKGLFG